MQHACAHSHFLHATPVLQGTGASTAQLVAMHTIASKKVLQTLNRLLAQQASAQGVQCIA